MQIKLFYSSLTLTFPQLYAHLSCCFCGLTYRVFTGAEGKTIYKLRTEGELSVLQSRRDVLIFSFFFFSSSSESGVLTVWFSYSHQDQKLIRRSGSALAAGYKEVHESSYIWSVQDPFLSISWSSALAIKGCYWRLITYIVYTKCAPSFL